MKMLNARLTVILRELIASSSPLTSEYLAKVLQVTSRTVRNDIRELELILVDHGALVRAVRGIGYELEIEDDVRFRSFLQNLLKVNGQKQDSVPNFPEERVPYLIKRLLLTDNYIKFEDLANELFVSKSTIQNDIRDVKKLLEKYTITLDKRPNYGVKLIGEEVKVRFCMAEYLFNSVQVNEGNFDQPVTILSDQETKTIREIILRQIKETNIRLSDISLNNLIIHIAIACKRIRNEHYVTIDLDEMRDITNQLEYEVAKTIVRNIESCFKLVFPESEIIYIAMHLLGTKLISYLNESNPQEPPSYFDTDIYNLTVKVLEVIEQELSLQICTDKELVMALCLHLKPAINRYKYGMNLRNPMLNEIKVNYPVAFEAAVIASNVIKKEKGIDINENETGFIALHIGAAIERKRTTNEFRRCLIVCASGVGSAELLKCKLQSKFGGKLEIVDTTEYYRLNEKSLANVDFIISTIPIDETISVPVIRVNAILGESDLEKIERTLRGKEEQLLNYTREELVFLQQNFQTREEVLSFLCEKLQKIELVDNSFLQSVMDREKFSPTSFGNYVAIPHPNKPMSDTTFWAICTLQKPIQWGDKRVQFICLLSVEKNNTSDLKKMYQILVKLIDDPNKVQQLVKCKNFKEFMNAFKK